MIRQWVINPVLFRDHEHAGIVVIGGIGAIQGVKFIG